MGQAAQIVQLLPQGCASRERAHHWYSSCCIPRNTMATRDTISNFRFHRRAIAIDSSALCVPVRVWHRGVSWSWLTCLMYVWTSPANRWGRHAFLGWLGMDKRREEDRDTRHRGLIDPNSLAAWGSLRAAPSPPQPDPTCNDKGHRPGGPKLGLNRQSPGGRRHAEAYYGCASNAERL